ncbi:acyl-CoA dehydrogenase, partial [Paracoccus aestuarii]
MASGVDDDVFQQLMDAVTRFARERLIPAERQVEEENEVPAEIIADMREMGLFGLSTPQEFGGVGVSAAQEAQLIEALCYASLSFRSLIGTNVGIGSQGIVMDGTSDQQARWLPGIASGEIIASFALTEPDHGSDAGGIR